TEENASHNGRALREPARLRRQTVDACGDQRLERVGDSLLHPVGLLGERADGLLDEERIPLGLRQNGFHVDRDIDLRSQLPYELRTLVVGQRPELERDRAQAATAPRRACVEQL